MHARRIATLATVLLASVLGPASAEASAAIGIASISPAGADRGDTVTIRGNGFGGPNVEITVGGIEAEVVAATGSEAKFVVPALAGPGTTTVRAENPGGQSRTIDLDVRFDGRVAPLLDEDATVWKTIGRDGGSLSAGGITLTIPAGALPEEHEITLTPLVALAGSPLASPIKGARLQPDGLELLRPAVLSLPIPPGYGPADAHGFGFSGEGEDFHLDTPHPDGGRLELYVWHFSGAGGSFGPFRNGVPAWVPGTAETRALQDVALAAAACQQDPSPACQSVFQTQARLAFDRWYQESVKPGLLAALGASSLVVDPAFTEWLRWQGQVNTYLDPLSQGFLDADLTEGRRLATNVIGDLALRRLRNCTGTDFVGQVRNVAAVADYVEAGAIDLTAATDAADAPLGLPDVALLPRACIHVQIDQPTFPAVAARNTANTLALHASVVTFTGAHPAVPLDVALSVAHGTADSAGGPLDAQGRFQTTVEPDTGASLLAIDATASLGANAFPDLPPFLRSTFEETATLSAPVRDRVELQALGQNGFAEAIDPLAPGSTATLRVRLAGDDVAAAALTYTLTGPGTLSATTGLTDTAGEARFVYTATAAGTPTIIATIDADGTSDAITLRTNAAVAVTVTPSAALLTAGATADFTAAVTGANDTTVHWTATGGTIDQTGHYTAGTTPGTYTVTATSAEDLSASDDATITIVGSDVTVDSCSAELNTNAAVFGVSDPKDAQTATCNGPFNPSPLSSAQSLSRNCIDAQGSIGTCGGDATGFGSGSSSVTIDGAGLHVAASAQLGGTASASCTVECSDVSAAGLGHYELRLRFTLEREHAYAVSGNMTAPVYGDSTMTLDGPDGDVFAVTAGSLNRTGTLPAGTYYLVIEVEALAEVRIPDPNNQFHFPSSSGGFDLSLDVS